MYARRDLKLDIVDIPDTHAYDGEDVYYYSSVYSDYETSAWGGADFILKAAAPTGATVNVTPKVSFDGGTSWLSVNFYTDLGTSSTVTASKSINFAPRVKVEAELESVALSAGCGYSVDMYLNEYLPDYRRSVDLVTFASTTRFLVVSTGTSAATMYSNAVEFDGTPYKMGVVAYISDMSKVTNESTFGYVTYMLQFSMDGTYWWDGWSAAKTDFRNDSSGKTYYAEYFSAESTYPLGLYARIKFYVDGSATNGGIASGHGIKFYLIGYYA
jgi:hypothetical protein